MSVPAATRPAPVLDRRRAGVLLHPTSLPSGTLDIDAERFLDWLVAAGFSAWQMLPVGPAGQRGSPYSSTSAFAGHVGLLPASVRLAPIGPVGFERYCARESVWLDDYALFTAIRESRGGQSWWQWPEELRRRDPDALQRFARAHGEPLQACRAGQYRFARHWSQLRDAAAERGVLLVGDLPMFVVADSADAWANPGMFRLDAQGRPLQVAGVPPDAFAEDGQCWANPVYDWAMLEATDFDWWLRRVQAALSRFDLVRWDHFRGLDETWEIPVGADGVPAPAVEGCWSPVPGRALLSRLLQSIGRLPLIAENLGIITSQVEQLRHDFQLPGLHVLQFAFDNSPDNPHLPENHEIQGVACTGTHDNDTALGWWHVLGGDEQAFVRTTLGDATRPMPDALIIAALRSRCRLAMIPLQDLLRLGSEARMNRPGVAEGQWRWQAGPEQLTAQGAAYWRRQVEAAERAVA